MTYPRPSERTHESTQGIPWAGIVLCACVLTSFVATWPLPLSPASAIPLGTEQEATVPLFNLWTLWWTSDRVFHGFAGFWDAPVFYPNRGAFAYSEPQPLTGLLVTPLWVLSAPPALIYNSAFLTLLTLNGIFAYRVTRSLRLPRLPALLGSLFMVTLPFIAKMAGVLPVIPLFGILWALEGLVRFGRTGALRDVAWAATGFVTEVFVSFQLALIAGPFVVAAAILALAQQRFSWPPLIRLGVTGLTAGMVVLVLTQPPREVHAALGFDRPASVVHALSARASDFLTRPATALVSFPPREPLDLDTGGLFPGMILVTLSGVGIAYGLRHEEHRVWTSYFLGAACLASVLSLGLNLQFDGWRPFATLRMLVPGFSELRSPYRFVAVAELSLAILAGIGLAHIAHSLGGRAGSLVIVALGFLGCVENLSVPLPLVPIPSTLRTEWTTWLRQQPGQIVVAHLPFPGGRHVSHYEVDAWRMLAQIDHGRPMINGYSGYFPPGYLSFQASMAREFPTRTLLCQMAQRLGVNTLVVDQAGQGTNGTRLVEFHDVLQPVYRDTQVQIYAFAPPKAWCEAESGT